MTTIKLSGNPSASAAQPYLIPRSSATENNAGYYISTGDDVHPYMLPKDTVYAQLYASPSAMESNHPYASPIAVGSGHPCASNAQIPNHVNKVYADPGSKKDVIFNWFKVNKVTKINSSEIK